jgi:hypothetical protein
MLLSALLRRGRVAAAVLAPALFSGCASDQPPTFPVQGRVAFKDGRPMTEGVVEFVAVGGDHAGLNARGRVQPDGTFRLTTFRENDGAIAGDHRAVVVWSPPPQAFADDRKQPRPPLHPRFQDYERSGQRFTVTRGDNEFLITVEKP